MFDRFAATALCWNGSSTSTGLRRTNAAATLGAYATGLAGKREDDPEYIVRLVGQVVRVSVETVKILAGLPEKNT